MHSNVEDWAFHCRTAQRRATYCLLGLRADFKLPVRTANRFQLACSDREQISTCLFGLRTDFNRLPGPRADFKLPVRTANRFQIACSDCEQISKQKESAGVPTC